MSKLPQLLLDEWPNRVKETIITTVDESGMPNSIYATCVSIYDDEKVLIANNYFNKTLANLRNGCKGDFLFLTKEGTSYQLKGVYSHYADGPYYEDMKSWNPEKLPGVGVAVLDVTEVFSGSKKIEK